jgi:hypothetical protein
MAHPGFVVAMAANTTFGEYDRPSRIVRRAKAWLIVSRWGPAGEYLSIASTQEAADFGTTAPVGLTPKCTSVGFLLSQKDGGAESTFLLFRRLPTDTVVAGSFFPTDGYARLTHRAGRIRLMAEGRYAHGLDDPQTPPVGADRRPLPCNGGVAFAWHVDAVQYPWSGEFVEPVGRRRLVEVAAASSPARTHEVLTMRSRY